jgi:hypothetical protein
VILFFLIAIARAWQLTGVRDTGLAAVIMDQQSAATDVLVIG